MCLILKNIKNKNKEREKLIDRSLKVGKKTKHSSKFQVFLLQVRVHSRHSTWVIMALVFKGERVSEEMRVRLCNYQGSN